jgi:hypothetical protein
MTTLLAPAPEGNAHAGREPPALLHLAAAWGPVTEPDIAAMDARLARRAFLPVDDER